MKRQTHNRISKQLLPWLDPKVIDKVNKAIDKPDPVAKLLSAITGQASKDNPFEFRDKNLRLTSISN